MFENFEQEEPENKRITLAIFLSLVLVPVGLALAFKFLPSMLDNSPQIHHTFGTDDAQLQRVHWLCASLPKPEKFELISRYENAGFTSSASSDSSTVIYRYKSERAENEIMPAFVIWFNENGWRRITNTATYEKGKQSVYISATFDGGAFTQYEIYCTEKD
jgi:hypothetical protein